MPLNVSVSSSGKAQLLLSHPSAGVIFSGMIPPCLSPVRICPHSLVTQCLFTRYIFNCSSEIKSYTCCLGWSEFSTPSIAPSLQSKVLIIPLFFGSQLLSCQSEHILTVPLYTCYDVWLEHLSRIGKTVLTQGNSLIMIIIISIPATCKTDPGVTAPFYLTHIHKTFSQKTISVQEAVKKGSEKSL